MGGPTPNSIIYKGCHRGPPPWGASHRSWDNNRCVVLATLPTVSRGPVLGGKRLGGPGYEGQAPHGRPFRQGGMRSREGIVPLPPYSGRGGSPQMAPIRGFFVGLFPGAARRVLPVTLITGCYRFFGLSWEDISRH